MKHSVRSNGIHFAVSPSIGINCPREIGLPVENVVPLEHDGEFSSSKEALRDLSVPYQFVSIECLVAVSSFGVHMDICIDVCSPWEFNAGIKSIGMVPRSEVACGL